MEAESSFERPRLFRLKKYLVTIFGCFTILMAVGILVKALNDPEYGSNSRRFEEKFGIHSKDDEAAKQISITVLAVFIGIFICLNLIGLMGAFLEHFCTTSIFVGLQLLLTFAQIIVAIVDFYVSSVLVALWAITRSFISLLFLRDIYIMRLAKQRRKAIELEKQCQRQCHTAQSADNDEVFCD